jgi:hypothetical protein
MTTTYPIVRLEAPGLTPLVLDPGAGLYGQSLDLGDAATREVVDDAPDADGTDDNTAHVGARSITLALIVSPDSALLWSLRQQLRAFTHPALRPTMFVQQSSDAPEQQVTLRRSKFSEVLGSTDREAGSIDPTPIVVTAQWVAPTGILESVALHDVSGFAAGTTLAGRAYSLTFSRVYPASDPGGTINVANAGTADAYPVIRLYGPCTEPVIRNVTQGKALFFAGLTLAGGEFIEIDTRAKTILFGGDPTNSRYDKVVFPSSAWFTLSPGVNVLRFNPATFTASSSFAEILWRDAYL